MLDYSVRSIANCKKLHNGREIKLYSLTLSGKRLLLGNTTEWFTLTEICGNMYDEDS